jgi:hypothetical protein
MVGAGPAFANNLNGRLADASLVGTLPGRRRKAKKRCEERISDALSKHLDFRHFRGKVGQSRKDENAKDGLIRVSGLRPPARLSFSISFFRDFVILFLALLQPALINDPTPCR